MTEKNISLSGTDNICNTADQPDYLVLVNRNHPLPKGWINQLDLTEEVNSLGETVVYESRTYSAYMKLKQALAEEGIFVQVDSCLRTVEEQQEIIDMFLEKYGEKYTREYAAVPGYSEHHTGLCLDLYFVIDGVDIYLNEDTEKYPEIWEKIHEKLARYGFILRYPAGKEKITGYNYEPWHIRYLDDPQLAERIMDSGITLEEYLGLF